jgi:hypothetical protein
MRGFTLFEVMFDVLFVSFLVGVLFLIGAFSSTFFSTDAAFSLSESKDIKVIVDPKTGDVSECVRPWVFSDWRCRPMSITKKSAEKE